MIKLFKSTFRGILFLFFFLFSLEIFGQESIQISQLFTEPNGVTRYNQYPELVIKYKNKLASNLESIKYPSGQLEIMVLTHFYSNLKGEISVHVRPTISTELMTEIEKKVKRVKIPLSRYTDQTLMTLVKIEGGVVDNNIRFEPEIKFSGQLEKEKYEEYTLKQQYDAIRKWSSEEAIPILARIGSNAGDKFGGVKQTCRMMGGTNFKAKRSVEALTDSNFYYWHGVMEMKGKDQLMSVSKVVMYAANGEFDKVDRYLPLIQFFSDTKTSAHYLLQQLKWRLDLYYNTLNEEIKKGTELNNQQRYDEAIALYDNLLTFFPASSTLLYEKFYTQAELIPGGEENLEYWNLWEEADVKIHEIDPLFFTDISARNGMEGYQMYRRAELTTLFSKPDNIKKDMVKYADIALDLEDFSLAAWLYWNCMAHFPESTFEGRLILKEYLYCLLQMGNDKVVKNFKNDVVDAARKVGDERFNKMVESSIFKTFEK